VKNGINPVRLDIQEVTLNCNSFHKRKKEEVRKEELKGLKWKNAIPGNESVNSFIAGEKKKG